MQEVITQVNYTKDLGILMQDDASFNLHIDKVSKKVKQKCGWICRTFYSRNPNIFRHMWNTLVQPHADYCSQLWAPSFGSDLEKLDGLLRSFTARIPLIRHLNYWERISHSKMNSQQRRIERYKIIYTWKISENVVPNCGIETIAENNRQGRMCKKPPLSGSAKTKTLRSHSFPVVGPSLFNSLPKEIRNLTKISKEDFKCKLDSFLTNRRWLA